MLLNICLFISAFNFVTSKNLKIEKLVCQMTNDVIKSEKVSTVALLSAQDEDHEKIRSSIHECLKNDVVRFDMSLEMMQKNIYMADSTLFIIFADGLNLVNNF